ncbi:hypothetical protein DIPPA_20400 [Diplonema papillatum]|nr:hypothetical protein DIPPA_20400 [Diplonema papillatum]
MVGLTVVKKTADAIQATMPLIAAAALLASPLAAVKGQQLVLLSTGCYVHDAPELPLALHPSQLVLDGSVPLGMAVGNLLVFLAFCVVMFAVLQLALQVKPCIRNDVIASLRDTHGTLRYPSTQIIVFYLVYQGMTLGASMLVLNPPSAHGAAAGGVCLAACLAAPAWIFYKVRGSVPKLATVVADREAWGRFALFCVGPGEWVSRSRERHWVNRYSCILRPYALRTAWFSFLEFTCSFTLSAVSSPVVSSYVHCGWVKFASAAVCVTMMIAISRFSPYARGRDEVLLSIEALLKACSMLFMAYGFFNEDPHHWSLTVSSKLLLSALGVLMVKLVMDVLMELFLLFHDRRHRLSQLSRFSSVLGASLRKADGGKRQLKKEDPQAIEVEHAVASSPRDFARWPEFVLSDDENSGTESPADKSPPGEVPLLSSPRGLTRGLVVDLDAAGPGEDVLQKQQQPLLIPMLPPPGFPRAADDPPPPPPRILSPRETPQLRATSLSPYARSRRASGQRFPLPVAATITASPSPRSSRRRTLQNIYEPRPPTP